MVVSVDLLTQGDYEGPSSRNSKTAEATPGNIFRKSQHQSAMLTSEQSALILTRYFFSGLSASILDLREHRNKMEALLALSITRLWTSTANPAARSMWTQIYLKLGRANLHSWPR